MSLSVRAAAAEAPDSLAVVSASSRLTFRTLAARVDAAVERLLAAGVGGGVRGALTVRPTIDGLVSLYAVFELGGTAVLLGPGLTPAERQTLLQLVQPVVDLDRAPAGSATPETTDVVSRPAPPDDRRPLAVVFTSGASGAPKAVVLSRAAFVASAKASAANLGWRDEDRWLLCLPPSHVGGLSILTRCLLARRTVALLERSARRTLAEAMDDLQATLISLVPTQLDRMLRQTPAWRVPERLRAVLLGGADASPSLREAAARRGVPVLLTYGLTETCSQVATQAPGDSPLAPLAPLPGVEIRIVNGRIQVRGPMLMNGYLPEAGAPASFLPDGWFDTGDLGMLDSGGRLTVIGRIDDLIITGGENVDPREVEAAYEQHPAVAQALVFGQPDAEWGQSVAIAVVPTPGASPSAAELAEFAAVRLAPFKRPRWFAIVRQLPLTPSGKLDRRTARRELAGLLMLLPRSGPGVDSPSQ